MLDTSLRESNISKFLNIMSEDDLIKEILTSTKINGQEINDRTDSLISSELLSKNDVVDALNSFVPDSEKFTYYYNKDALSNEQLTLVNQLEKISISILISAFSLLSKEVRPTRDIIQYFYQETWRQIHNANPDLEDTKKESLVKVVISFLTDSMKVVHCDYNINTKYDKSLNESKPKLLSETGFAIKKDIIDFTSIEIENDNEKDLSKESNRLSIYKNSKSVIKAFEKDLENKKIYIENENEKISTGLYKKKYPFGALGYYRDGKLYRYDSKVDILKKHFDIKNIIFYKSNDTDNDINKKEETTTEDVENFVNYVDDNKNLVLNRNNSSLSFIMLNNPKIRVGTQNSLELATFLNSLSTIELSKCMPYLDVKFILPSTVVTKNKQVFKTSSLTSFLNGTNVANNEAFSTNLYRTLSADFSRTRQENENIIKQDAVEANMSIFTAPQTMNNFDEKYTGHLESYYNGYKKLDPIFERNNIVQDITKPFLTIKNFSVDVAPTQGLMSFKTGRLSLTLHDKSRMSDIAPFIKPDLFGSFGAEIAIHYGWSHMDAINKENSFNNRQDDLVTENYFAKFLNEKKLYEKYIITNSSYNIDANGQVNIELSIAMKGPVSLRAIKFEADGPKKILDSASQTIVSAIYQEKGAYENLEDNIFIADFHTAAQKIASERSKFKTEKEAADASPDKKVNMTQYSKLDKINEKLSPKKKLDKLLEQTKKLVKAYKTNKSMILFKVSINSPTKTPTNNNPPENPNQQSPDSQELVEFEFKNFTSESKNRRPTPKNIQDYSLYVSRIPNSNKKDITINAINVAIKHYNSLIELAKNCNRAIASAAKNQNDKIENLIDKITAGLSYEDAFFDNINQSYLAKLDELLKVEDNKSRTAKNKKEIDLKNDKEDNIFKTNILGLDTNSNNTSGLSNEITLGNLILAVIGTHMSYSKSYDEIQIISHTLNNHAGLAANRNVASLRLNKKDVKAFITSLFENGGTYTLESLLTQIVKKFIMTRYCVNYGLRGLYKLDDNGNVEPRFKDNPNKQKNSIDERLKLISEILKSESGEPFKNEIISSVKFVLPKIKLLFDTTTDVKSEGRLTILRISLYDENDNPFESLSSIANKLFENDIESVVRDINKRYLNLKSLKKGSKKRLEAEKIKYLKENEILLKKLEDKGIISGLGTENIKINLGGNKLFSSIKERLKAVMPSITYGATNSGILDASISTVNESKLNTVYLTRPGRNGLNETSRVKTSFNQDMPLRILPSQSNITMFGCPFVNFAQYIFLDFETNTTVDNQYVVTGIKHDISPGKFTTSLTLSYGDAYGKYENIVDTVERVATEIETGIVDFGKINEEKNNNTEIDDKDVEENQLVSIFLKDPNARSKIADLDDNQLKVLKNNPRNLIIPENVEIKKTLPVTGDNFIITLPEIVNFYSFKDDMRIYYILSSININKLDNKSSFGNQINLNFSSFSFTTGGEEFDIYDKHYYINLHQVLFNQDEDTNFSTSNINSTIDSYKTYYLESRKNFVNGLEKFNGEINGNNSDSEKLKLLKMAFNCLNYKEALMYSFILQNKLFPAFLFDLFNSLYIHVILPRESSFFTSPSLRVKTVEEIVDTYYFNEKIKEFNENNITNVEASFADEKYILQSVQYVHKVNTLTGITLNFEEEGMKFTYTREADSKKEELEYVLTLEKIKEIFNFRKKKFLNL